MDICTLEQSRGKLLLRSKRICMQLLHTFSAKHHIKQRNRCSATQHKYSAHNDTSEIDCHNRNIYDTDLAFEFPLNTSSIDLLLTMATLYNLPQIP